MIFDMLILAKKTGCVHWAPQAVGAGFVNHPPSLSGRGERRALRRMWTVRYDRDTPRCPERLGGPVKLRRCSAASVMARPIYRAALRRATSRLVAPRTFGAEVDCAGSRRPWGGSRCEGSARSFSSRETPCPFTHRSSVKVPTYIRCPPKKPSGVRDPAVIAARRCPQEWTALTSRHCPPASGGGAASTPASAGATAPV
jgi:hypothetical protein